MERKRHNIILILILVLTVFVVGTTFAYFTSTQTVKNVFQAQPYSTEITDTFVSPDNWVPGTVTPKTVSAKNTGNVDVAVRISYTESWVSQNGDDLSLTLDNGQRVAIISLINTDDWTYNNGYYYYNDTLGSGESTSSLIESVKFNENAVNDYSCTTVEGVISCTSTGNGYDGATYTLTMTVETVQADAKDTVWKQN